jgi:prevent-host-death family protein
MNAIPMTIPISDLRARQNEILAALRREHIVLTQHGRPAAVMVSPEEWNQLMAALEDLEDALDAAESRRDREPVVELSDYLAQRGSRVRS